MDQLQILAGKIISITSQIVGSFGPLVGYTKLIIGIGALFIITLKTASLMATGQSIKDNWPALAKPFFLLMLIIFYSGIIGLIGTLLSPIASGTDGMATSLMQTNESMETKFYKDLDTIYGVKSKADEAKAAAAGANQTDFLDDIGASFTSFKTAISDFSRYFTLPYILGMILSIIQIIVNFILKISFLGILLLRSINLAILIIFGPIAIALSVWSPLGDNWKPWIVNYVSKYMWLPIAQVTLAACYTIKNEADKQAYEVILKMASISQAYGGGVTGNVGAAVTVGISDYVPVLMSIGLTVISVVAMTQVPSFTNLIVSGATQGMTQVPSPGYAATRAAGAVVNAPLSMASGGLKKVMGLGSK